MKRYSNGERIKAIELYIQYDKQATVTVRELGYPSSRELRRWYADYVENQNTVVMKTLGKKRYSKEKKQVALDYYFQHGRNISRSVKMLGYPSRNLLAEWRDEVLPDARQKHMPAIQYSQEQKKNAVIDFCNRIESAALVAENHSVRRETLYRWKSELLSKEAPVKPHKSKIGKLKIDDIKTLEEQVSTLQSQVYELQLEKDILEGTIEILKKDPGVDPKDLTNQEKTSLVGALKSKHKLPAILLKLELSRSSYYYQLSALAKCDKYATIRIRIKQLFDENCCRYGYRRIHGLLSRENFILSEKVLRRIMIEETLIVYQKRSRKYSSYKGEDMPSALNEIERDFHADQPNEKWLTDITEFAIPAGKVYLSPIVDCFDGMLTSWKIGTSPNAELVNSMLDEAISTLKEDEHPLIHSDRGCHYRWPGWLTRMTQAGLLRSMSKKGCSPDNAACEGLFGRVKNEMFYNHNWQGVSINHFTNILNEYLLWYNVKRIKISLGNRSPIEYRRELGLLN